MFQDVLEPPCLAAGRAAATGRDPGLAGLALDGEDPAGLVVDGAARATGTV